MYYLKNTSPTAQVSFKTIPCLGNFLIIPSYFVGMIVVVKLSWVVLHMVAHAGVVLSLAPSLRSELKVKIKSARC